MLYESHTESANSQPATAGKVERYRHSVCYEKVSWEHVSHRFLSSLSSSSSSCYLSFVSHLEGAYNSFNTFPFDKDGKKPDSWFHSRFLVKSFRHQQRLITPRIRQQANTPTHSHSLILTLTPTHTQPTMYNRPKESKKKRRGGQREMKEHKTYKTSSVEETPARVPENWLWETFKVMRFCS